MAMVAAAAISVSARGDAAATRQDGQAQPPAQSQSQPARPAPKPTIPLKITVVISRVQGEKKTASLPFTLAVTTNDQRTSLRMGADVPLPMTAAATGAPVSYNYKSIGTNIDCGADTLDDGRFRLLLTVTDSQIFSDATGSSNVTTVRGVPSYQNFTSTTPLILRDGQSTQFTTATDKLTGEVVRVDVTLNVVK
jgi:hypothetical protein